MIQIFKHRKQLKFLHDDRIFKDSLPNYRLLSEKQLMFKGPMTRYYSWPSKYTKPMEHQIITADFMTRHRRGYVFNAIGTGKTLCMDWIIDYLIQQKEIQRALIIAPLSTLESVHVEEIRQSFRFKLKYAVLHGSRKKRLQLLAEKKDVYIINHDGVAVILEELYNRKDIDCVFIDEVAILRNKETDMWEALNILCGTHTGKMVWGFTGSPMPKAPTDCYAQALLINPDKLPKIIDYRTHKPKTIPLYKFRNRIMYEAQEGLWLPKDDWEAACYSVLQPSIRFKREECVDLPPTVYETRNVELSKEQTITYKQMVKELKADINGETVTAFNEGVKLTKLLQISSGAVYDGNKDTHVLNYKPKLKVLRQIIDASNPGHVLIFAPYRNILGPLVQELNLSYGYGTAVFIDSMTPLNRRTELYQNFNKGDLRFIVAIPSCMAHGLNLQHKCSVVVWWSPIVRYDHYEQACGRVIRAGQANKTLIVHLQSAPVEREIYRKLAKKEKMQGILLKILEEK